MSDLLKYIAENMTEKDMEQEGEMKGDGDAVNTWGLLGADERYTRWKC